MVKVFPRCELHDHPIVWEFPKRCPFASDSVHEALIELRDASFPGPDDDPHQGVLFSKVYNICQLCVSANSAHPTVARLRTEVGIAK